MQRDAASIAKHAINRCYSASAKLVAETAAAWRCCCMMLTRDGDYHLHAFLSNRFAAALRITYHEWLVLYIYIHCAMVLNSSARTPEIADLPQIINAAAAL
jgi:hypothetical protein